MTSYTDECKACGAFNCFDRQALYFEAFTCWNCSNNQFFEDYLKTKEDLKKLEQGKIDCAMGEANYVLED